MDTTDLVDGSPEQVRERLTSRLLPVSSVWFPTRRELAAWDEASAPLYLQPTRGGQAEIGLRLDTIWASRMTPCWRLELRSEGTGRTRLVLRPRYPTLTVVVMAVFATLHGLWGLALWQGTLGEVPPGRPVLWWLLLAIVVGASSVGWSWGRSALEEQRAWLLRTAAQPRLSDEDW